MDRYILFRCLLCEIDVKRKPEEKAQSMDLRNENGSRYKIGDPAPRNAGKEVRLARNKRDTIQPILNKTHHYRASLA